MRSGDGLLDPAVVLLGNVEPCDAPCRNCGPAEWPFISSITNWSTPRRYSSWQVALSCRSSKMVEVPHGFFTIPRRSKSRHNVSVTEAYSTGANIKLDVLLPSSLQQLVQLSGDGS